MECLGVGPKIAWLSCEFFIRSVCVFTLKMYCQSTVTYWISGKVTMLILFILAFSLKTSNGFTKEDSMISATKALPLKLTSPTLLDYDDNGTVSRKVSLSKELFKKDIFVQLNINTTMSLSSDSYSKLLLVTTTQTLEKWIKFISANREQATSEPIFVFCVWDDLKLFASKMIKDFPIRIDQMVYFFNLKTGEMIEIYSINDVVVERSLWNQSDSATMIPDFVDRRGNFHGVHVKSLTEPYFSSLYLRPGSGTRANLDPDSPMYEVTDYASGPSFEFTKLMSLELNFTYSLYRRKDRIYGTIVNGTPSGIIRDLYLENVDLVSAYLTFDYERSDYIYFLPIITGFRGGLFIGNQLIEDVSWTTFIKPFHWHLWITMFLVALMMAVWFQIALTKSKPLEPSDLLDFAGLFWATLMANAGRKPASKLPLKSAANKLVLFTCLLVGNIIWMGYRASITSELSVTKVVHPFNSMEGLSRTDYKSVRISLGLISSYLFLLFAGLSFHQKGFPELAGSCSRQKAPSITNSKRTTWITILHLKMSKSYRNWRLPKPVKSMPCSTMSSRLWQGRIWDARWANFLGVGWLH